jgi:hypothetical protein
MKHEIRGRRNGDCGQSVFLLRGDDTLVLCIDTDKRYFRDLSLIKIAEIMFIHQVLDEGRAFT